MATSRFSHRETDILKLLTEGLSQKEIDVSLGLAAGSVKVRLTHARRKVGARSTDQLVAMFVSESRDDAMRVWALHIAQWMARHERSLPREAADELHAALGSIVRYIAAPK